MWYSKERSDDTKYLRFDISKDIERVFKPNDVLRKNSDK